MKLIDTDKCSCYHTEIKRHSTVGVCWGTKEIDECSCNGDKTKCDFYPEYREEAKRNMEKDYAVEILKALACCSVRRLSCSECPMWEEFDDGKLGGKCYGWTDEDVFKAVRTLNGETIDD